MKSTVKINSPGLDNPFAFLTKRESECINWLSKGKTVPEIAEILMISKRTAEKYIITMKEKLGCYTMFQLGEKYKQLSQLINTNS